MTGMESRIRQVDEWLRDVEGEHLEFKEAKNSFEADQLGKYCCALANEGGGRILLGVERSGQGMNRMFERSIRQGKQRPDFSGTDEYQVTLTLHGQVTDPRFVTFLEQVGQETLESFSTEDFLVLDHVHRDQPIPADLRQSANRLRDVGVLEAVGRGRGVRYLLSRRFHRFLGTEGAYTRLRGLDKEHNKELLVQHLAREGPTAMEVLQQVLPGLSRHQIARLLDSLRSEGRVDLEGVSRGSRWVLKSDAKGARE